LREESIKREGVGWNHSLLPLWSRATGKELNAKKVEGEEISGGVREEKEVDFYIAEARASFTRNNPGKKRTGRRGLRATREGLNLHTLALLKKERTTPRPKQPRRQKAGGGYVG